MISTLLLLGLASILIVKARRERLRRRLAAIDSGVTLGSRWRLMHEREALIGLIVGLLISGLIGAWAGTALGIAYAETRRRKQQRSLLARVDRQIPDLVRSLVATLRVGGDVTGALLNASDELTEPIATPLRSLSRRLATGATLDEALHGLRMDAPTDGMERVVEAIRVGTEVGGDLEAILRFIGDSVRDRLDIDSQRHAATSQGRLSAVVVGGMPIVFLALTGSSPSSPSRVLLTEPLGWMLLGVGLSLEGLGFFWVHRLVSR